MKPTDEYTIKESIDFIIDSFSKRKETDTEIRLSIRERQLLFNIAKLSDKLDFQKDAMSYLEKLTPQGSEFVNDPKACYEHIQQRLDNNHELIKKKFKENKQLIEENKALNASTGMYSKDFVMALISYGIDKEATDDDLIEFEKEFKQ